MKKLSKKKWLIVIVIFTILLILKDPIYDYLTFEQDVEDLAHFGIEKIQEIKNSIIKSNLSMGTLKFKLTSVLGLVIPIIYIFLGYDYNNIKNKLLKYNIGKNNDYNKKIIKEKIKLSLIGTFVAILIYLILMIVGYILGGGIIEGDMNPEGYYLSKNSILYIIFGKDILYAIFVGIHIMIATFLNGIFIFCIIDKFNFIKGVLLYLAYMWIGTMVLYHALTYIPFLPRGIVPMESIVGHCNTNLNFIKWILSFLGIIIPTVIIKVFSKIEVE